MNKMMKYAMGIIAIGCDANACNGRGCRCRRRMVYSQQRMDDGSYF